jgi:hypothetical protein
MKPPEVPFPRAAQLPPYGENKKRNFRREREREIGSRRSLTTIKKEKKKKEEKKDSYELQASRKTFHHSSCSVQPLYTHQKYFST